MAGESLEGPQHRVDDTERGAAAELLRQATGDGRLTLAEFTERVGAVWAADHRHELDTATAGLAAAAPARSSPPVTTVVAVIGDQRRTGRWRIGARLSVWSLLGDVHLDLCDVLCAGPVVEIRSWQLAGDLKIQVPDGVEVELRGFDVLGDRELAVAPAPPQEGTPLVRVRAYGLLGDVRVRSAGAPRREAAWRRWLSGRVPPPPDTPRAPVEAADPRDGTPGHGQTR